MLTTAPNPWSAPPGGLHPLDHIDRQTITELLVVEQPSDLDIADAARLVARYRDSLLSRDLTGLLTQVLEKWGMTSTELFSRARALWQSGWRPDLAAQAAAEIGSGSDVEE